MKLNLAPFDVKQKLNRRETMIFMATLLVAFLGFFKGCVQPNQKALEDTKQKIEGLELERIQLTSKKQQATSSKQWVGSVASVNQSIDALTRPSQSKGIQIVSMALTDPVSDKKKSLFTKKEVVLTLSGTFPAVGHYIEYLENLPVPLLIESLSVAPDGNRLSRVTVKIQGGFYASK